MLDGLQGSWHKSPLLSARAAERGQHVCNDARRGALYVHPNASDMLTLPIFQCGREDHLIAGESGQYDTLGRRSQTAVDPAKVSIPMLCLKRKCLTPPLLSCQATCATG